jgi:hypothetical protein
MKASSYRADCSRTSPTEIRARPGKKRVYFLVENRSFFTIFINFDTAPTPDGAHGVELLGQMKYELWGDFTPTNESIYFIGTQVAAQQVNYAEGYFGEFEPFEVSDHS